MRVLWIVPYLPVPVFGGGTRVYHLLQGWRRTAEIDLIAGAEIADEESLHELRMLCRTVTVVPRPTGSSLRAKRLLQLKSLLSRRSAQYWMHHTRRMQECIDRALHETQYDVVVVEHSFLGCYSLPQDVPVVLDQHNVESEIFRRGGRSERSLPRRLYNQLEFRKYRAEEQAICRRATMILATSEHDRELMGQWKHVPPCHVIPNGVDCTYFTPRDRGEEDQVSANLVFVGAMHYAPNTEAMVFFAHTIWPRIREEVPEATLAIVGMNPPTEIQELGQRPGISVVGYVPDVRPYLACADVVVAPLRIGGGTRLKILEAMAMGKAVVSTAMGCEGLDVTDGVHLLVADDPDRFAARTVELLRNPTQRAALGGAGRCLVEQQYDWRAVNGRVQAVIQTLLSERPFDGKLLSSDKTVIVPQ